MFYTDTWCYVTPKMKIELHIMYYRWRYFFVFVFDSFSFLKSKAKTLLEGFSQLWNQKLFDFKPFVCCRGLAGD